MLNKTALSTIFFFFNLWYDSARDGTQVSRAIGEHSSLCKCQAGSCYWYLSNLPSAKIWHTIILMCEDRIDRSALNFVQVMYSYGPPHMAVQKQDDQHEHTFSSYVRIRDVVLKTYLGRWTIGRSGERGSGISVLPARYDDDDWSSSWGTIFYVDIIFFCFFF